jgi:hypothetical protein
MNVFRTEYTRDECLQISSQFKTRKEFQIAHPNTYKHVCSAGLLDEACEHMGSYKSGYRKDKPGYLYTVEIVTKSGEYVGFGITNYLEERLYHHKRNCNKADASLELIESFCSSGEEILKLEKHLKTVLPIVNTGIEGFKTEAILKSDLNLLTLAINMCKIAVL